MNLENAVATTDFLARRSRNQKNDKQTGETADHADGADGQSVLNPWGFTLSFLGLRSRRTVSSIGSQWM